MEAMIKKNPQRFRKLWDEMDRWTELQTRLISQFRNASSIIERLQVLQNSTNYGRFSSVGDIREAVLAKQMCSLQDILLSMKNPLEEFHSIVLSIAKIHRDGKQMIKGGSSQPSLKQLQRRIGVNPSLAYCLDGLMLLREMHQADDSRSPSYAWYLVKLSVVSALALKPNLNDLRDLQVLLIDQPNIPKEKGD